MSAASRVQQREILAAVESLASSAAALLQDLVRIPSVTGDEAAVQGRVLSHLQELGLETDAWCPTRKDLSSEPSFSDDGLPLGERPVVVGRLPGTAPEAARSLVLNGHVDVVPPGDEASWQDSPWSGALRDGRIFGRGSCDMKGGLVSGFLAVAGVLKAGVRPRGDVWVQSVIGEETGGAGTLAAIVRGYRADAAIVLEPTRLRLCPVGAGAASFRLHVTGQSAHAAMRREGVSAIEKLYPLLTALQHLEASRNDAFRHPLFDPSQLPAPISIGKVLAGDWPSTVPGALVAEGRHGILPGETLAAARASLETAVAAAAGQDDWLKDHPPRVEWFEGQFEPAETPRDSPILAVVAEKHTTVCGGVPAMEGVPYGSDLRFFTNRAAMPAVLYGPGDVRLAHSVDESIPLAEVIAAAKVVALTINEWCQ